MSPSLALHHPDFTITSRRRPIDDAHPGKRTGYNTSKKGLRGFVQAESRWNEELNSHVESEGFPAVVKGPAVYVQRSWVDYLSG